MSSSSAIEFTVTQEPNHVRTFSRKGRPAWSTISSDLRERFAPTLPPEDFLTLRYVDANGDEANVSTETEWAGAWDLVRTHYAETDSPFHFALVLPSSHAAAGAPVKSAADALDSLNEHEDTADADEKEHRPDGSDGQSMPSAFVPKSETEDRASSKTSSSDGLTEEANVKVSWKSTLSESGSDIALVIVSKEEAREAETDWEQKALERASASKVPVNTAALRDDLEPTARSYELAVSPASEVKFLPTEISTASDDVRSPFTPVTEGNPGPAFTPTTEGAASTLASEFVPISETADSSSSKKPVEVEVEVEDVIGSRAALSSGVVSAADIPLPSDSESNATVNGKDEGVTQFQIRIDTSVSPQPRSITGSPKVIYASPTFTDNAAPRTALPKDDESDDFEGTAAPRKADVHTDSDESADSESTTQVSRRPLNARNNSSPVLNQSNLPDLLSQSSQRSHTSRVRHRHHDLERRAPAQSYFPPPPPTHHSRKGSPPIRSTVSSVNPNHQQHARGRLSISQLLIQVRDSLADEPAFYYTLKGLLAEHTENEDEKRAVKLFKGKAEAIIPSAAPSSRQRASPPKRESTDYWYDAQETDTHTDSSEEEIEEQVTRRAPAPSKGHRNNTVSSSQVKQDLPKVSQPPRPLPLAQRPIAPANGVPIRHLTPPIKITRPTGDIGLSSDQLLGHHGLHGLHGRAKVPHIEPKPPSRTQHSHPHPKGFDAFVPRSETLMFAEAARASRLADVLADVLAESSPAKAYWNGTTRPQQGIDAPIPSRRHTLSQSAPHPERRTKPERRHTKDVIPSYTARTLKPSSKGFSPFIQLGRTAEEWPQSGVIAFDFDDFAA